MIEAGGDPEVAPDQLANLVEALRVERPDLAAGAARDVLLVAGEGVHPGAVAGVEMADEAEPLERVEVAIDRGEVGRWEPAAESGRDVLGGDRPVRGEQRLEHQAARSGNPMPVVAEPIGGLVDAARRHRRGTMGDGHDANPS